MPRTLLIIDEFQEFFSEDDKLAQDAGLLLDRLVRQGRAFGIHVLLGSQTIGGETFNVSQSATSCTVAFNPGSVSVATGGGGMIAAAD